MRLGLGLPVRGRRFRSCKERVDCNHTRNVAVVAFGFHGNLNFYWMRFLEGRFPGNALRKLLLHQTLAAPFAISVFYTGVSFMEGREEVLQDWGEKFLNTYKHHGGSGLGSGRRAQTSETRAEQCSGTKKD